MPNWTHTDVGGLSTRYEAALERSLTGQWGTGPIDVRGAELRALTMGTVLTAYRCLDNRAFVAYEATIYDFPNVQAWPDQAHYNAAQAVLNTLVVLADGNKPTNLTFITNAGNAPQNVPVEGWPILLARVAASAIWAVAACYIAERYEDTIDRALARADVGKKMMAAQADALKVLENHADTEVKAGKTLPYSPQEQATLGTLLDTQKQYAAKPDPPKDDLPGIGESGTATGMGIGMLLALGLVGYFVLKGKG